MRLCIIWDWRVPPEEYHSDKQGKLQAWRELGGRHEVTLFTYWPDPLFSHRSGVYHRSFSSYSHLVDIINTLRPDVILSWGSIDRPAHRKLIEHGIHKHVPIALQFAGGNLRGRELDYFDMVFTQSKCDQEHFQREGIHAVQLFGVDKSFWTPDPLQDIRYEAIYPASFCQHKQNWVVAERFRERAVLTGKWDEKSIVDTCKSFGSLVLPHASHEVLRELYRSSRQCVIPAVAGSQRTVGEALSCGLEVELIVSNNKCQEILDGDISILDVPEMAEIYERELEELIT